MPASPVPFRSYLLQLPVFPEPRSRSYAHVAGFVQLSQQRTQFKSTVNSFQAVDVCGCRAQFAHRDRKFDIESYCCELLRQSHLFDMFPQALADFARDFFGVIDDAISSLIQVQPFRGGFGTDLGYAGNIVGRIAYQREVVDNLLRVDIKFFFNTVTVHDIPTHRVDESDVFVDELCHVLVAC